MGYYSDKIREIELKNNKEAAISKQIQSQNKQITSSTVQDSVQTLVDRRTANIGDEAAKYSKLARAEDHPVELGTALYDEVGNRSGLDIALGKNKYKPSQSVVDTIIGQKDKAKIETDLNLFYGRKEGKKLFDIYDTGGKFTPGVDVSGTIDDAGNWLAETGIKETGQWVGGQVDKILGSAEGAYTAYDVFSSAKNLLAGKKGSGVDALLTAGSLLAKGTPLGWAASGMSLLKKLF